MFQIFLTNTYLSIRQTLKIKKKYFCVKNMTMRTHGKNITATVVDHHEYKLIQYDDIIIKLLIYIPNSAVPTLCGSSPESGTKTTRK